MIRALIKVGGTRRESEGAWEIVERFSGRPRQSDALTFLKAGDLRSSPTRIPRGECNEDGPRGPSSGIGVVMSSPFVIASLRETRTLLLFGLFHFLS